MTKAKKRIRPRVMLSEAERELAHKEIRRLVNKQVDEIRSKVGDEVSKFATAALAIAARDEFDFGKQRILKLERRFLEQFNAMVDGRITLQDIETAMLEEVGIDFNKLEEELGALK